MAVVAAGSAGRAEPLVRPGGFRRGSADSRQDCWKVPVQVPVIWTPPIVTVHGTPLMVTGPGVAEGVGVGFGVADGVGVGVAVGVAVGVGVGFGVADGVGVADAVGVGVADGVGVGVGVGFGVGVGVGPGVPRLQTEILRPAAQDQ